MNFTQLEGMRGVRMSGHTDNYVPASVAIKPLHDRILVHPLDVTLSRTIQVIYHTQPVRGIVLACGPGTYPIRYRYGDKDGKRVKVASIHTGKRRPIEVRPGDIVELGGTHNTADGGRRRGYSWESLFWGDCFVIWATERDICGITGHQPLPADLSEYLDQRPASERPGVSGRELSGQHAGPAMGARA
jgi:hypothetical protein